MNLFCFKKKTNFITPEEAEANRAAQVRRDQAKYQKRLLKYINEQITYTSMQGKSSVDIKYYEDRLHKGISLYDCEVTEVVIDIQNWLIEQGYEVDRESYYSMRSSRLKIKWGKKNEKS